MVQEQGRRRDRLLGSLLTHPNPSYWPCTHGGKDRIYTPLPWMLMGCTCHHQVECCIGEWSTGTWKEANWSEERYNGVYRSHLNSLHDLRNHGRGRQGENLLAQIQFDLLKEAR